MPDLQVMPQCHTVRRCHSPITHCSGLQWAGGYRGTQSNSSHYYPAKAAVTDTFPTRSTWSETRELEGHRAEWERLAGRGTLSALEELQIASSIRDAWTELKEEWKIQPLITDWYCRAWVFINPCIRWSYLSFNISPKDIDLIKALNISFVGHLLWNANIFQGESRVLI